MRGWKLLLAEIGWPRRLGYLLHHATSISSLSLRKSDKYSDNLYLYDSIRISRII